MFPIIQLLLSIFAQFTTPRILLTTCMVSVIIPTRNYGHYIAETLDSLVEQTYPLWECLIIDDGSTDNTRSIVERYIATDQRFSYVYQKCQGVSAARNAGLLMAKGSYIQFLDADDLLTPTKLSVHSTYLDQHPDIDIVYSNTRYFANDDKTILSFSNDMRNIEWLPKISDPSTALNFLAKRNIMPIQAPLSRAAILQKVGLFDLGVTHCEDWLYWLRCAMEGCKIIYLESDEALSFIRLHGVSAVNNGNAMSQGAYLVNERVFLHLLNNPKSVKADIKNDIIRAKAVDFVRINNKKKGLRLFISTIGKPNNNETSFIDLLYWLRR